MRTPAGQTLLGAALIALLTLVAYSSALRGGFIWDDDSYVSENKTLASADGLGQIWFDVRATPQYYPIVFSSFWVEYHLWGLRPFGYHAVNVALHVLGAVLLLLILQRLTLPGAWLAAAIFALHPVHVESVAWITERKNVLSGVCYFASLLAFLRFRPVDAGPETHSRSFGVYVLAVVLYACALLSKTAACSLPAAILLICWWKRGRLSIREIGPTIPMFAIGLVLALLTVYVERYHVGAVGRDWTLTVPERCLLAGRALWFYLGKLIWPVPVLFVYPRWAIDDTVWWQYLFPAAAVALFVALFALRRRIGRGPLVAALFFGGTLFPTLGFFNVYIFRYSWVADHFQYLASIGPIALIAAVLTRFTTHQPEKNVSVRRRGRKVAVQPDAPVWVLPNAARAVIVVILCVLSWRQGFLYKDVETLWRETLAHNQDAWLAHHNLAKILEARGDLEGAVYHNRETLRVHPDDPDAHNNLGLALMSQGKHEDAITHLERALELNPGLAAAHSNLAILLLDGDRVDDAIDHLRKALDADPSDARIYCNLAVAFKLRGEFDEAIASYEKAAQLEPNIPEIHFRLGDIYMAVGRYDDALGAYRRTLVLRPDYPGGREAVAAAEARRRP